MTTEEILASTALNSWKLVIGGLNEYIEPLSDEQLQQQVAPGRNRLVYLVGHLTATHDRLFPMLGLGNRLHPDSTKPISRIRTARSPTPSHPPVSSKRGTR